MTMPDVQNCMLPTLLALRNGSRSTKELDEVIAQYFNLTEEERSLTISSGKIMYKGRAGWARVYLKKAGLLATPQRALFELTESGRQVLALPNLTKIDNKFLSQNFPAFREFIQESRSSSNPDAQTIEAANPAALSAPDMQENPDELFEQSFNQINNQLADEIVEMLLKVPPFAFERLVLDFLKAIGYGGEGSVKGTSKTRDNGIDGVIYEDVFGFNKIFVQIKHYSAENKVQRQELQAFIGAISGLDGKGLFVTTSDFTQSAVDYAQKQNLVLLNGKALAKLMIEHDFGVSTVKTYAVKRLDRDLFDQYTSDEA